ncbi:hypothetical protein BH24ACT5_BH24ACT5_11200 [soil metagenome]
MTATESPPTPRGNGRLRTHLGDDLYRTGYLLIGSAGITSVLGVAFWSRAAHTYSSDAVGLAAAAISSMTLVSGACSLGLYPVLVRYLPIAGTATRKLVTASYALTATLSLVVGAVAAMTSATWAPKLSFLSSTPWLVAFSIATAGTTIFALQDGVLTGLRSTHWIPIENALFALCKLGVLFVVPSIAPFIAWNVPILPAIFLVNIFIFRRVIPHNRSVGMLARRTVFKMAAANYGGSLFGLVSTLYLPVLVANLTTATEAAYFYLPWLVSASLQLVALNMMTSLTVEAAIDMPKLTRLASQALTQSFRLVLPLVGVLLFAAPYVLLIFGDNYADAGTTFLRWLAIGAIPNIIVSLGVSVARITDRSRAVVAAQAGHAAAVIAVSAVLLSRIGIVAVGIAWTMSQTMLAGVMLATILRPLVRSLSGSSDLSVG